MGLDYRAYAAYSIYFKMGWEMSPPQKAPFSSVLGKNRDEKGEEVRKEEGKGKEELEKNGSKDMTVKIVKL